MVVHRDPYEFEHQTEPPLAEPAPLGGDRAHTPPDLRMVRDWLTADRLRVDAHQPAGALAQNELGLNPHSGLIVVFRPKRGDRIKVLLWDGSGLVMVCKRLEAGSSGRRSATA